MVILVLIHALGCSFCDTNPCDRYGARRMRACLNGLTTQQIDSPESAELELRPSSLIQGLASSSDVDSLKGED